MIAYIHRTNDNNDKLVVAPSEKDYTDEQIRALSESQEQFFESIIIRKIEVIVLPFLFFRIN